jgi:predicted transcriptional regulator
MQEKCSLSPITPFLPISMGLATDYLSDYLQRLDLTQVDFAKAAGMTQTNLSDILKGDVEVSARNIGKLLRGLSDESERDAFIAAHLRDQIPEDQAERVVVHVSKPDDQRGGVMEDKPDNDTIIEAELVAAFAALPSSTYRKRVLRLLRHLRKDADLRDLFSRTVAYLEDSDRAPVSYDSPVDEVVSEEEERRESSPAGDARPTEPSNDSKKTPAKAPKPD